MGGAHDAEQLHRIALVEHGEALVQSDGTTLDAQQPVGDGVERPAPDPFGGGLFGELAGSGQHLLGGAPGECQQQDPLRRHAPLDQMSDPRRERPGLAGAGTGDDQQRRPLVGHRRSLGGIEPPHPPGRLVGPALRYLDGGF